MNFRFRVIVLSETWFLTSPITSLKHVFGVKQSYILHRESKFSETYCIGKRTSLSIYGTHLKIWYPILDTWHSVQVRSTRKAKNLQGLGRLP
jgi:hypothetical protein